MLPLLREPIEDDTNHRGAEARGAGQAALWEDRTELMPAEQIVLNSNSVECGSGLRTITFKTNVTV